MRKKERGQVTLGQLAKEAGVSRSTVSRALKDNPVISPEVRQRIRQLAERLGYKPDPEAARLMSYLKSSPTKRFESVIGILNAYENTFKLKESEYTGQLIEGATQRAKQLGYSIDLLHLGEEGMTPRRLDQIINARGIRGVLIPPEPDPLFKTELDWSRIAAVATTTTAQPLNLHRVLPHNFFNIRLILDKIIESGYRRIGLIAWDNLEDRQMSAPTSIYALYAYIEKRIEPLEVHNWIWQDFDVEMDRMGEWYRANQPEVILGWGKACVDCLEKSTGMKVPADVKFVCYGDSEPHYSRINQSPGKVGAAAVDVLSAHIQRGDTGIPKISKVTLIEGEFIEGETLR